MKVNKKIKDMMNYIYEKQANFAKELPIEEGIALYDEFQANITENETRELEHYGFKFIGKDEEIEDLETAKTGKIQQLFRIVLGQEEK